MKYARAHTHTLKHMSPSHTQVAFSTGKDKSGKNKSASMGKIERAVFDRVFHEKTTTQSLYQVSCNNVAQRLADGYNETIMMYGQTGAGKTYTMFGDGLVNPTEADALGNSSSSSPSSSSSFSLRRRPRNSSPGMCQFLLQELFEQVHKDPTLSVELSCVQVYNERVMDLLGNKECNAFYMMEDNMGQELTDAAAEQVPERRSALTEDEAFAMLIPAINVRHANVHSVTALRPSSILCCRVVSVCV